ncbi:MAG: hypothetical protein ACFB4I_24415 [Cyanophyceae cyanobacterium]
MTKKTKQSEQQALEQAYKEWLERQAYQQDSWADTHLTHTGGNHA